MAFGDNEPVSIVFFGGIKINQMETNAAFTVGESFFQSLESQVKNNLIAGQTFGDFGLYNFNNIASPLYDPDGWMHSCRLLNHLWGWKTKSTIQVTLSCAFFSYKKTTCSSAACRWMW